MRFFKVLWFMITTPLRDQFYCFGCSEQIHRDARAEHEARGHSISLNDEQYYHDYERYSR